MSFNNILKAIPTSTNKELNDKLAEFAEFIDIYENAESNKIIISFEYPYSTGNYQNMK